MLETHLQRTWTSARKGTERTRGFKGAPLLTSATNLRNSILLALPASFSPRSAGSFSASFPSPRTPFDAVAQRMRSASASAAIRSSRAFGADVAEELQALYDEADPFDLSGDSAFFVSGCASALDPKADLNRFEPYRRHFKTHQRTISLKGNGSFERIRSAALQKKTWSMKTTIYDLSTADVAPNRAPVVRSATVTRRRAATMPSSIVFTTTNSPELVSSASVSPIKVSSETVGDDLRGLRPVTDPLLTIQRRPVLGDIQNYPSKNVDTLLTKPAGTCPSPAHYRHSTDALPGPRSTLRPLILPGRFASRIAMTDTADLLRPVTTDTGCRSKGLDDIIALLEARDGSGDNVVDVEGPSEEELSRTSYAL
ncbi:hypothetical protein DXG03_008028 [Asterophora parasitica]|uniref:Uncharacterized protein n=1 Tax=Asterophora parasitica TaxID=117018 RepID=A0A9P7G7H4_9AGAR|nr:hypothetical protein DXG03_008028 [Asterophora parasitica]